jgi:hypothetical protein
MGLALGAKALAAKKTPKAPLPPPPPGVHAILAPGVRRVEVIPEGRLLAVALPLTAEARRRVVLLVERPQSHERALLELDLATPTTRVLADHLSAGIDRIDALDLDGDGAQEVLLGEPHQLYVLRAGGVLPLAAPGFFDLAAPDSATVRAPARSRTQLVTAEAGRLRCYAPAPGGNALVRTCDEPLPLRAERESRGLLLETPPTSVVARPGAAPLVLVGPQTLDQRRLRTLAIEPGTAGSSSSWARLPELESVQQSRYAWWNGAPVLAVSTVRGDKLRLFEDQRLRLFHLTTDRTQEGHAPFFVADTASARWHALEMYFGDVDGDGRDDLTVIEPKGMGGNPVFVKTYLGTAAGGLASTPSIAKLDVEATSVRFGDDVTGDHRPDLVALAGGELLIFAGRVPGRDGAVSTTPTLRVPLTTATNGAVELQVGTGGVRTRSERFGWQPPFVADLDGDGRGEILLLALDRDGPGALEVVTWR